MIITKTPFRISFVGGGSDLQAFYSQSPGAVLSTTIDKFMYISSHRFFDERKIRLKYSRTETVSNTDELRHPIVREVLQSFDIEGAMEISSNADVPAGTGLGSSSSFTVGLLHNLYTVSGQFATKVRLAEEACDIEINRLAEPIGKQDQYAAAFGGLNVIHFNPSGTVTVERVHIKEDIYRTLQNNLLMFYTGEQREASSILSHQTSQTRQPDKTEMLKRMVELVWELRDVLYEGNLHKFGSLLHANWLLKQQLTSGITNSIINEMYETGIANGATGGKLLGAGGGGFMLFYAEPQHHARLRSAFSSCREMKVRFEDEGSKVVYVGDEYHES